MIDAVKRFFENFIDPDVADAVTCAHREQVATAALLVEMMRADFQQSEQELGAVLNNLQREFQLTAEESRQLLELAVEQADSEASLHAFTRLINESYSEEQKVKIIEMLWQVALADARLDKYEEYLVRKIAALLYVRHKDFLQAKHRVAAGGVNI